MLSRDLEKALSPFSTVCPAGRVLALAILLLGCVTEVAYSITPSPQWAVEGDQEFANLGIGVSTAGDVNGDGYSDAIVVVAWHDNQPGWAFVYHGSASGLAATPAWTVHGGNSTAGPAGDVNGDGYSDVILGVPDYTNGQSSEGRAMVYLGSATGLASTPAWTVESNQSSAEFGSSVGTAGDVNGDGYADVIVGARYYEDNVSQVNEGGAFIYLGSASGLATTPATTLQSNVQAAYFGSSVGTAGDVNGDGYADVIVGAPNYDNVQGGEGAAFVYLGSATGTAFAPVWSTESNQVGAALGNAVGTAGDVNGDGYADVIVGVYQFDTGIINAGRALVFHGLATGLATTAAWTAESGAGAFGTSVGTAGDVNGDGYADVIVGAPNWSAGQAQEGLVAVYLGSYYGLRTTASWWTESNQLAASLGQSVATAGDVNGDGRSDIIMGIPYWDGGLEDEGSARVYHGTDSGLALGGYYSATSSGFTGVDFGASVATAGDVNGDGYSDVIIADPSFDNNRGRVYVHQGSRYGVDAGATWTVSGVQAQDRFGSSVASAGDVNGDGFSDVIIGAVGFDNGQTDEGRVSVYLGSATGLAAAPSWTTEGNRDQANLGISVATAGDVNGDGFSDIVIGQYRRGGLPSEWQPWHAYAFHGSWLGLAGSPSWSVGDSVASSLSAPYTLQVATAGDVNADGYSDVIVGMDGLGAQTLVSAAGRAFVYHGSSTGLGLSAAWMVEGQIGNGGEQLGHTVASAGDVNGDGFSDVIVGHGTGAGLEAQAFHGSALGLALIPAWTVDNGGYSQSVATAGDVDGDGYSDVVLGEPWYTGTIGGQGRAIVYGGSPSGIKNSPLGSLPGDQANGALGTQVTAGDVNGDGFSDVISGAPDSFTEGEAWIFHGNSDGTGFSLNRVPQQIRTQTSTPVSLLGSVDSPSSIRLKALGRTPAGRGRVRVQAEVKPIGSPFNGTGVVTGPATITGAPTTEGSSVPLTQLVEGLSPSTPHRWRLRVLGDSPFFPGSIWMSPPGNAPSEVDFRTWAVTAVEGVTSPSRPRLAAAPNPFRSMTQFLYDLPRQGRCRLSVFDVHGRRVSSLTDGFQAAGRHVFSWNGRAAGGGDLPGGIYFLKLEAEGIAETQKVVIVR